MSLNSAVVAVNSARDATLTLGARDVVREGMGALFTGRRLGGGEGTKEWSDDECTGELLTEPGSGGDDLDAGRGKREGVDSDRDRGDCADLSLSDFSLRTSDDIGERIPAAGDEGLPMAECRRSRELNPSDVEERERGTMSPDSSSVCSRVALKGVSRRGCSSLRFRVAGEDGDTANDSERRSRFPARLMLRGGFTAFPVARSPSVLPAPSRNEVRDLT